MICHIVPAANWEQARLDGEYAPASLASEGFIHFSTPAQLADTAERHYAGVEGLLVLHVEEAEVTDALRWENGYPHLYAPLDVDAVSAVTPLPE
jgi:uncharacterized protein (DUF952 family)